MPSLRTRLLPVRVAVLFATLLATTVALLTAAPSAVFAADIGPAGRWEGAIKIPGAELGVIVDLAVGKDGAWNGDIDIPLQGAKDLALADVKVEAQAIRFSISGVPGTPTFQGKLAPDGQSIAGDFTQGGASFPFTLARKGEAAVAAKKGVEELLGGFDAFVEAQMKEWKVPGVAIAIVKDGKVVLERGYGQRDVKGALAVDAATLFAIGSSTKAFTALDLALLVDEGKLEWDKPVVSYMPDFKLQDETATKLMTPRDLLTHRSGLPRHDLMWYGSNATREEMYGRLQYLQPSASVRNRFQYQNLMVMTAGILAGELTGTTWEAFTRERILVPLGMESTVFSAPDAEKSGNLSKPYELKKDTEELTEMAYRDVRALGPAGTIYSSANDMADWLRLQLGDGTLDGKRIVSATQLAETHKPQMVAESPFVYPEKPIVLYGLGWFVQPYRGHARIHHGGNIDGFSAMVSLMPDENAGAVILTNLNGNPLAMILADAIHDRLLELEPIDWSGRFKARREQGKATGEGVGEGAGRGAPDGDEALAPACGLRGRVRAPGLRRADDHRLGQAGSADDDLQRLQAGACALALRRLPRHGERPEGRARRLRRQPEGGHRDDHHTPGDVGRPDRLHAQAAGRNVRGRVPRPIRRRVCAGPADDHDLAARQDARRDYPRPADLRADPVQGNGVHSQGDEGLQRPLRREGREDDRRDLHPAGRGVRGEAEVGREARAATPREREPRRAPGNARCRALPHTNDA